MVTLRALAILLLPDEANRPRLYPASSPATHASSISGLARLLLFRLAFSLLWSSLSGTLWLTVSVGLLRLRLLLLVGSLPTRPDFFALIVLNCGITAILGILFFLFLLAFVVSTTTSLLLDVELGCFLDNVVARALDCDSWIGGLCVLLDLVAFLGGDRNFAFFLLLGYCAARCAATPIP